MDFCELTLAERERQEELRVRLWMAGAEQCAGRAVARRARNARYPSFRV